MSPSSPTAIWPGCVFRPCMARARCTPSRRSLRHTAFDLERPSRCTMKPVERTEILDLGSYERVREHFQRRVIAEKRARRVALGPNMTVLFENHDTVLLQIQEMLRTERIT